MAFNIIRKITYNWHIKLLSLILGILLWVYVDSTKEKEKFISVPTQVINVPQEYNVASEIPRFVKVVLKGKESNLALVDESIVKAYIDLENSTKPKTVRIVRIDMNSIPQGVSVKKISPRIIEVRLEQVEKVNRESSYEELKSELLSWCIFPAKQVYESPTTHSVSLVLKE